MIDAPCVRAHGGKRTDANKLTYFTEEVGRLRNPLVPVQDYGTAGTCRNSAKAATTVSSNMFVFIIHHSLLISWHTETHYSPVDEEAELSDVTHRNVW